MIKLTYPSRGYSGNMLCHGAASACASSGGRHQGAAKGYIAPTRADHELRGTLHHQPPAPIHREVGTCASFISHARLTHSTSIFSPVHNIRDGNLLVRYATLSKIVEKLVDESYSGTASRFGLMTTKSVS